MFLKIDRRTVKEAFFPSMDALVQNSSGILFDCSASNSLDLFGSLAHVH